MALADVQTILQGLRQQAEQVQSQNELALRKQQLQEQVDARNQQIELQRAQLEEEKKQHDIAAKAAGTLHELALRQAMQKLEQQARESGTNIPGAQVSPAVIPQGNAPGDLTGGYSPSNTSQATHNINTSTLPSPTTGQPVTFTSTIPTPIQSATEQANLERITGAPKEEAKVREARAIEAQKAQDRIDYAREVAKGNLERVKEQNETKFDIAKMMAVIHAATLGAGQTNLVPHIQDVIDGSASEEDIRRLPIPKNEQAQIIEQAQKAGARPIDKKAQEKLEALQQLPQIVKLYQDFIQAQPQVTGTGPMSTMEAKIKGLGSSLDSNLTNLGNELRGRRTLIAQMLSGDPKRVSNQEELRVEAAYIPSRFDPVDVNVHKYNELIKGIDNKVNAVLSNLPEAQRRIIRARLGLNNLRQVPGGTKSQPKQITLQSPDGSSTRTFSEGDPNIKTYLDAGAKQVTVQ